ncbi:MAG: GTP-binding protein [Candidatus Aenigmarchaeota archaeon]|nr:GTP-binding protein [Candidatus Aenigmarchaeota archaeon]
MKIPLVIVTGYLGSGKTTLLRSILQDTVKKIAIIMNEFGDIGIDGKTLKGKNADMIELSGGCVCCSLTGELEHAINEIIGKYKPDYIIVETTGVAEPDAMITNLESIEGVKLNSVVCVVDAYAMMKYPNIGHTGLVQIENADILLLNKTDLVKISEISELEKMLGEINKEAEIIRTVKSSFDLESIMNFHSNKKTEPSDHTHDEMEFIAFVSKNKISKKAFEEFANSMPENIYRAKGFVNLDGIGYLFNYVAGKWDLEKFEAEKTEIIFIGKELGNIKKEFGGKLNALNKSAK